MPNYVQNVLYLEGEESRIKELFAAVKGDNTDFDFNNIIPMPKELDIESSSKQSISLAVYLYRQTGEVQDILRIRHDNHCQNTRQISVSEYIAYLLREDQADFALGERAFNNIKNCGHSDWYGWCTDNWGTKWNAVEAEVLESAHQIRFQTAWSAPSPHIGKTLRPVPRHNRPPYLG